MILHHRGFPIRKSAGRSLFAAHRSLSQLVTSFFGSWCQGIHLMLLFAWTFCIGHLTFAVRFFELLEFLRTYFSVCSKKALAFSPFHFLLAFSRSSKLFFTLLFLKDQYFSILCPQYLFVSTLSLLFGFQWTWFRQSFDWLVGTSGLEPPTSRLSGARSNHLSYAPIG